MTKGVTAKVWKLDCPKCEGYLRGDGKPKVIKVIPGDKENNIPSRMEHVIDSHPQWSNTPEGVPPTPDEQHVNKIRAERGSHQLQQLQALAALQAAGLSIPDEAMWLLEQNFDKRIIRGRLICSNGHETVAGAKHCMECGVAMAAQGAVEAPALQVGDPDGQEVDISVDENGAIRADALPLRTLHVATLKKMAREKGLSDKGTKVQLIERLESVNSA